MGEETVVVVFFWKRGKGAKNGGLIDQKIEKEEMKRE